MLTALRYTCLCGWMAVVLTVPAELLGREPNVADVAYGTGVQAYFSGNSSQAEQHLAEAIGNNPDDPRPYYFRGLSLLRLGRADEARHELAAGAMIEARRPGRYSVGRALERVQGHDRLMLEEMRREARAAVISSDGERQRARYQPNSQGDAEVLRQQVAVPLERLIEPSNLRDWAQSSAAVLSPEAAAAANERIDRSTANNPLVERADDGSADDSSDPFADDAADAQQLDAEASMDGQKVPPEKMWGIMSRVLRSASPLPSLEGLSRNVPFAPPGGDANAGGFEGFGEPMENASPVMPADGEESFDFGPAQPESNQEPESDPFGDSFGPPAESSGEQDDGMDTGPSESLDEDPFGDF